MNHGQHGVPIKESMGIRSKSDHIGHGHHNHAGATGNIGIAFLLNLFFALVELVGGFLTGSVAIMADALHDLGDSLTLALAWVLQRFAARGRSPTFTYGYGRLSLLSSLISGFVLFGGSVVILFEAIPRLWDIEQDPHGWGMMGLAIFGIAVNGFAAFRLSRGNTRNEKMLSWHLVEDLLGWVAVLIGSIVILVTGWGWVDPLLAIGIALYIGFNVVRNLWETILLFLQKVPEGFEIEDFKQEIRSIDGVTNVHDIHVWTMDGEKNILSMHVELHQRDGSLEKIEAIKSEIRDRVTGMGKFHLTVEIERAGSLCPEEKD